MVRNMGRFFLKFLRSLNVVRTRCLHLRLIGSKLIIQSSLSRIEHIQKTNFLFSNSVYCLLTVLCGG